MTITAILVLAVGTYAFRIAGPLLRERMVRSAARRVSAAQVGADGAGEGVAARATAGAGVAAEADATGRAVAVAGGAAGGEGPGSGTEVALPARVTELMSTAATVLLVALIATAALTEGGGFAGVALPVGVVAGGVLAWRKVPFVVVVIVSAGVAAGLRALGVP